MSFQRFIPLIARTFLSVIFLRSGFNKLFDPTGTREQIAGAGIPLAGLVLIFTILFEIAGALSIILGYKARIGAILLTIFLIPATLVFHNPLADPTETIQFLKNLSILGGLLMVYAFGSGPLSLDNRFAANTAIDSPEVVGQESRR
jgi:putative oxidoreductase